MKAPIYRQLASLLISRANCLKDNNTEWHYRHAESIADLVQCYLPDGSGFDNGTEMDVERSTPDKLVFTTSYHHMNDGGMYDGWTSHTVTVRPSLAFGIEVKVSGSNRNDIKDDIWETFHYALTREVEQTANGWKDVA